MPDYNLGRAHGTVRIDYDGKGAQQAAKDIDDIGGKSEKAGHRVKASSDTITAEHARMAKAAKQLENDVVRATVAEITAQARVQAANEDLARVRQQAKSSAEDLARAEKRLATDQVRAAGASSRLRAAQQSLETVNRRLASMPQPKLPPGDVDEARFNTIVQHLRNIDKSSRQSVLGLNTFSSRLRLLISGSALAAPQIAGLAVSLVKLAGLAGVAAGGIAALGATIATLATGFSGIGAVFKEAGKSAGGAGQSAAQAAQQQRAAARQITQAIRSVRDAQEQLDRARQDSAQVAAQTTVDIISAERTLRDAQRDSIRSQEQLSQARRDATRQLEDMRAQLLGGALDERQAIINVQRAQEELNQVMSDPRSSGLDREQAVLNLEKEKLALEQTRTENKRLGEDSVEAAAKGVDGSDNVQSAQQDLLHATEQVSDAQRNLGQTIADAAQRQIDAQRAVRDAVESLVDAQLDLQDAYANAAISASAAGAGMADAMSKISPEARKLVSAILAQSSAWRDVKFAVQDALFSGLSDQIAPLARTWLPLLKAGMVGIAQELNRMAQGLIAFLKTSEATSAVKTIFDNTKQALHNMGSAIVDIIKAFLALASVGSSFLPGLATSFANLAAHLRDVAQASRDNGSMKTWIQESIATARKLFELLGNIASIIGTIFTAFDTAGGGALNNWTDMTDRLDKFLKSAQGQDVLHALATALSAIGKAVTDVLLGGLKALGPAFVVVSPLIVEFARIVADELVVGLKALGAILFVVAKVLEFVGPVLIPVIASVYALNKAIGALGIGFKILNGIMNGNVFILIAAAIIAIAFLIIDNWDVIWPFLVSVWEKIRTAAMAIWEGIKVVIINPIRDTVQAVKDFFVNLWNTVVAIWNGAVERVKILVQAFVLVIVDPIRNAVQNVINFFRDLPGNIMSFFSGAKDWLFNIGKNIIQGLLDGIQNMFKKLMDKINSIGRSISDAFSNVLGIFSPSKVFAQLGEFTMQGYIVGIDALESEVLMRVVGIATEITAAGQPDQPVFAPKLPPGFTPAGGDGASSNTPTHIENANFYIAGNLDPTNPTEFRKSIKRIKTEIEAVDRESR
jgi:phage-related protein